MIWYLLKKSKNALHHLNAIIAKQNKMISTSNKIIQNIKYYIYNVFL